MSSKFLQKFQEKITVVGRDGSTQPVCLVGVPSSPKRHLRFPDNHGGSASAGAQSRSSASEFSFGPGAPDDGGADNRRPFPPQASRPSGDDAASGASSSSSHNPNRKLTVRDLRRYSESAYDQPPTGHGHASAARPGATADVAADHYFDSLLSQALPLRHAHTAHPSVGQREHAAAQAANRARESVSQAQSHTRQYAPRSDASSQRSLSIPRARPAPANAPRAQQQPLCDDSFLNRIAFSRKAPENVEFKPYLQPFKKGEYFELGTLGPDLMDADKVPVWLLAAARGPPLLCNLR